MGYLRLSNMEIKNLMEKADTNIFSIIKDYKGKVFYLILCFLVTFGVISNLIGNIEKIKLNPNDYVFDIICAIYFFAEFLYFSYKDYKLFRNVYNTRKIAVLLGEGKLLDARIWKDGYFKANLIGDDGNVKEITLYLNTEINKTVHVQNDTLLFHNDKAEIRTPLRLMDETIPTL